ALASARGGALSHDWNTTALADGPTYVLATATDINFNRADVKIPVVLANGAVDASVPGSVVVADSNCITHVSSYGLGPGGAQKPTIINASLRFEPLDGARGYRVYRADNPGTEPVLVDTVHGGENVWFEDFDPELTPGMNLRYLVAAFNNRGEGPRTEVPPMTVLDRFDVHLTSPGEGQGGVFSQRPVFEWKADPSVGEIQFYRLVLAGVTDPKGIFTWDTTIENKTSAVLEQDLAPARVYHWDILSAYAAQDRVSGNKFRSYSFPGPARKDPYAEQFMFVTSAQNGCFTFTTDRSGGSGVSDRPAQGGRIIIRLRSDQEASAVARDHGSRLVRAFRAGDMVFAVVELPTGTERARALDRLGRDERIVYAEPAPRFQLHLTPNDPDFKPWQYGHLKMDSAAAWDLGVGSEKVTMAIIDTGLDGTHPEFSGRVVTGHNFHTKQDVPPGVHFDSYGHGTHVAGIAGATGNNGLGVAGVDWKARIMPLKVNDEGEEVAEYVIESIPWAVDHGADVLNLSLGGPGYSQALQDVVSYACLKGALVVVSMGNNMTAVIQYPAACQGAIAVGSTDGRDQASHFSTWGEHISVSAPGSDILSTSKRDHGYVAASGTSMAAPQVAGALTLLRGLHPDWSIEEMRSHLEATADDVDEPGFDIRTGWGRINLHRLLAEPKAPNRYGRVAVLVRDPAGEVLEGADVVLSDIQGRSVGTVRTDAQGRALFFFIPAETGYEATARVGSSVGTTDGPFELRPGSVNPDVEIVVGS
ncbi:MAG: hypothetical protein EOM25_14020, partial [Deltaproteobacteria bacterium]|nr:hypothetical protein [Deltaproteobacteria bacterium]